MMVKPKLSVGLVQKNHTRFDLEGNLSKAMGSMESSEADLLVLPEMFLTGYALGDEVFDLALHGDDERIGRLIEAARRYDKYMIIGLPARSDKVKGHVHNSALVISPMGFASRYDKIHLVDFGPFEERAYYTPGRDPLIVDVHGWKVGIMVCYDLFFPELSRYYALKGADVIACISASPSMTRRFFEEVMKARAIENTVYLVFSNMVGIDGRMDFWGGSTVIGPRGEVLVKGPYYEEADLTATMEIEVLDSSRRNRPTIRDARPYLFRELARLDEIGER